MSLKNTILSNVATIREQASQFLTDSCKYYSKTGESVVSGESIPQYSEPVTTACRFIVKSGSESVNVAAQERAVGIIRYTGIYMMQVPIEKVCATGDKIEYAGRMFSVVFAPPVHAMTGAYVIGIKEIE
jgi:hypothetical protein